MKLTEQQKEYFKDSVMKDRDGNLVVCYHHTNAEFNNFDKAKVFSKQGYFGAGFYFTSMSNFGRCFGENNKEVYLNIKNPLIIEELSESDKNSLIEYIRNNISNWEKEDFDLSVSYKGYGDYNSEVLTADNMHWGKDGLAEYDYLITAWARSEGYDGIVSERSKDNIVREIVVFEPNQIKSVDDRNPVDIKHEPMSKEQYIEALKADKYWYAKEEESYKMPYEYWEDKEFVLKVSELCPDMFAYNGNKELADDRVLAKKLISKDANAYFGFSDQIKHDKEYIELALNSNASMLRDSSEIFYTVKKSPDKDEIITNAIAHDGMLLYYFDEYADNKAVVYDAVYSTPLCLGLASQEIQCDEEILNLAIERANDEGVEIDDLKASLNWKAQDKLDEILEEKNNKDVSD